MNWYNVQGLNIIKKDMSQDDSIWFDYGHGGNDPGCTFFNGTKEKDYVLKFGRAVYAICSQYIRIGQTRTKDVTVAPSSRTTLLSVIQKNPKVYRFIVSIAMLTIIRQMAQKYY